MDGSYAARAFLPAQYILLFLWRVNKPVLIFTARRQAFIQRAFMLIPSLGHLEDKRFMAQK
jgi:hypothetical protein